MVIVTHTFICDACHKIVTESQEAGPFSDPVVVPPSGWDFIKNGDVYACAECVNKEKKDGNPALP